MKYLLVLPIVSMLFGVGCTTDKNTPITKSDIQPNTTTTTTHTLTNQATKPLIVLPVQEYTERLTLKPFGAYVQDRFNGYHVGDDIEFTDEESLKQEIPVVAIADGVVTRVATISGYGGLMTIDHQIEGKTVRAIYGHIDLASTKLKTGDRVLMGQFLANLGDHESQETDGERKHLHFGLYEGTTTRINGYESNKSAVEKWINPTEFFKAQNIIE